ncbi:acyl-CoA dehydrogenase [Sulfodiicoccus acidiphilus]|uniref:Acyl-CoA dehydrogenase n=1 Tax=Sulfodiicoccus acidiphilus TaxID=1670455 RepID=A0A348B1J9_9CREN|nr:acyl-CoA dehydrogenase family protein [Sulfodiicoccus acidiphilus]BBD72051.1 acyl-CoA dehydrogenase [Sulfodiicoccus acidiphilus]GGU00142.1 acyl-CoA dehydrogenase [Sulfodiicoccus acidiphilus]
MYDSETLELMLDATRELSKSFPESYWVKHDKQALFPSEFMEAVRNAGLNYLLLPKELGGLGLELKDYLKVLRTLTTSTSMDAGDLVMAYNVFGVLPLRLLGNSEQLEKFLPTIMNGSANPCVAITEPGAGVDTLSITTRAEYKAGEYIITGRKVWTTMAGVSRMMILLARTGENNRRDPNSLTLFLLDPSSHRGLKCTRIDDIALKSLGSYEVVFDNVSVPEEAVLGKPNEGWRNLARILNAERVSTATLGVGLAELVINKTVEYTKVRKTFGKPIGANQAIQFPLAEAKMLSEAGWRMAQEAAMKLDLGENAAFEANSAAFITAKAAFLAADAAMQAFGGMAFGSDTGVEMHWRNARLLRVGPVPEQMTLAYVSHNVLGLPRSF